MSEADAARAHLERSCAELPAALRAAARVPRAAAPFDPRLARRILTTGVGSSAGHARFLAHVLSEELGLPARFVSTGALEVAPAAGALGDALIVFSQGLSPNARLAFSHSSAWGSVVLVTAQGLSETRSERSQWYAALVDAGVSVVPFAAPDEFGSLVRMAGPMLGYAAALALADSLAQAMHREVACGFGAAAERVEHADAAVAELLAEQGLGEAELRALVEGEVAFLASEGYGELLQNLPTKWMELTLGAPPPLWDAAEFAHGGLQRAWAAGPSTLVHLSRGLPADDALGRALVEASDSEQHRVVELRAHDAGAASVFEHEALVNALLLRWLRAVDGDPSDWPGKGRDAPLYDRGPALEPARLASSQRALASSSQLALATWPEVDALLEESGATQSVAVLGLGSIEQHGPHLAFATDAWIGDWLVQRVASRLAGAVALPVMPFGCASEHAAFPGTLSLEPATFVASVCDLLASVEGHGFDRAFVFSAHGGNLVAMRDAAPAFERACPGVVVCDDHTALNARLAEAGRAFGIAAAEQGHHAGELETSILAALRPDGVRTSELREGIRAESGDAQRLFYPSLRDNAPTGVVGDPRRASASRGDVYLETWAEELLRFYRAEASARSGALRT